MKEALVVIAENVILVVEAIAIVTIAFGTAEAFARGLRIVVAGSTGHERREVWLRFDRWLVAGLTFLLAADIIESTIAVGWENLGRLSAVAAIRTFLNYFLDRDVSELRERQHEKSEAAVS